MKKCIIFCAADFHSLLAPIDGQDYVIAADGGLRHTQALGLTPHAILGDFDSLGYIPQSAKIFPKEKDDTDAMLAIRHGLSLGYKEFFLYGALGGNRLDHTLANCQALQFLADQNAVGYLIGEREILTVVKDGTLEFYGAPTGILSLFCLGPEAKNVYIEGMRYEMAGGCLNAGFPLGVSNHFLGKPARICVEKGSLLALWNRENLLPDRRLP